MKKFNAVWLVLAVFAVGIAVICKANLSINPPDDGAIQINREQQHITAMAGGADPLTGESTVPADGTISKDFTSHLPIVVIDLEGNTIPLTKVTTEDQEVIYTGEDPYVTGEISIIDNDDYVNRLDDDVSFISKMKIKYRGNFSLNFDKKQYGIKLVDDKGQNAALPVMGMEANNDWILNVSQLDESLLRNYLAYNIGSALFEGTPECRYCEVVLKDGDEYNYQGLYLMLEKVEKSEGRVELNGYDPGEKIVDYLLCRDREDSEEIQISTYGDQTGVTSGRLSVVYPDAEAIDDYAFNYIQDQIDNIDRILYSDDDAVFSAWPEYIDIESFADYFIFNELMSNYDAGHNSTYMYKKGAGKLHMGPVWDYDGSMDNALDISNPEYLAFYDSPWFDKLVTSEKFMSYSVKRYEELTSKNNILSDEFITDYIDDVSLFLGNAAQRDRCRWQKAYDNNIVHDAEDSDGNIIPRDSDNWQSEVTRLKSYFVVKELYMGDSLKKLKDETVDREHTGTYLSVMIIAVFVCAVVLIRRKDLFV